MPMRRLILGRGLISFSLLLFAGAARAQYAELTPANPIRLPALSDSSSPAQWMGDQLMIYQSYALPMVGTGTAQDNSSLRVRPVFLNTFKDYPLWIESTWVDDDGTVYAWYHHESWVCPPLAVPSIGALISYDGGYSFQDIGIVMESGYANDCSAKSETFAGGHGDFTVLLDPARQYFYFYFSNYGGPLSSQGVAVARMAFSDRSRPVGRVWKYYQGGWSEPGLKGRVSAFFPARVSWASATPDAFWGPSIHWNTYLNQYVMLMNHSCCSTGWSQEGVYISYNTSLADPQGWSEPVKLLGDLDSTRWYPEVIGLAPGDTDKSAGQQARFYMGGDSDYIINFYDGAETPADPQPPANPDPPADQPPGDDSAPPAN